MEYYLRSNNCWKPALGNGKWEGNFIFPDAIADGLLSREGGQVTW